MNMPLISWIVLAEQSGKLLPAASRGERELTQCLRRDFKTHVLVRWALLAMMFLNACSHRPHSIFDAVAEGDTARVKSLIQADPSLVEQRGRGNATPLYLAVGYYYGQKDIIEALLAARADVNAKSFQGETPLHCAAKLGRTEAAMLLLAKGAHVDPIDKDGNTPLLLVNDSVQVAEVLLANKADVNAKNAKGWTPLQVAADNGRIQIAELLLAHGADVNAKANDGKTPVELSSQRGFTGMARLLRRRGGHDDLLPKLGSTATIYEAIKAGDVDKVKEMLAENPKLTNAKDSDGQTPLHLATIAGDKDLVEILLAVGADVDAESRFGDTPLMYASGWAFTEVMRLLIEHGADVNAKDNSGAFSPLFGPTMTISGGSEAIGLLIAKGANVSVADNHGMTPLHHAVMHGNINAAMTLL